MAMKVVYALILIVGFVLPSGCAANDEELGIVVEASSSGLLKFNLSNNSEHKLTIKTWQVPWTLSVPYPLAVSTHVLDTKTNRPRVPEQAGMHVNEILGDIEIEPGGSIVGEVHVESRFHDPKGKDTNNNYIVYWTYSLPICDLDTTFVHIGAAERKGESFKVVFQKISAIPAPPRCGD